MEFNHSTETISPDDTVPIITIGGTGGLRLPVGETIDRPIGQGGGVLRLNTASGRLEYNVDADVWSDIASTSYVDNVATNVVADAMAEIGSLTRDMTGFPDQDAHSTLSINESTRTVTLTPSAASMDIYHRGIKFTISTPLSIVFSDTYGGHYICFDPQTQTLIDVGAQASIREDVLVAYVFWDDVNNKAIIFGDERHGSSRNVEWHYAQHQNVGAVWRSGGRLTYDLNASALVSFALGNTTIADEDLEHFIVDAATPSSPYEQTLSPAANVPVLYLSGTLNKYIQTTPSTLPWLPNGSNGTYYNDWNGGDWILSTVPEGYYVVYWLIATNDTVNPVKLVLGREVHATIDDAVSETFDAYNLPLAECVPLYQFTLRHSFLYTLNPCRVHISAVRAISSRETVASDAFVAENHGNLTGRSAADQHPISAITDLQTSLDSKLTKTNLTVTTAAATAAKTTTESVTFADGVLYNMLFTLGNTVSAPTINGISVRLGTTAASTTTFTVGANAVVPMLYVAATNTLQLMGSHRTSDSIENYSMTDGTVAAPGWAFTNEADVGFHRPTAGALSIVSNNGEQVRVSGVTNAVNYVELAGNTAGDGPIVGANGASTNIDLYFRPKGTGAVYVINESDGLIFGAFNGAGATPNTQYLTFTNAAPGSIPHFQSNGTDATVPIRYLTKSATGYHQFSTTTNNNILTLQSVTSGVNSLTITNAVSTGAPSIAATGSVVDVNINLTPQGAGGVNITSGSLLIGGNAGTSGQVLTSNGASAPSWQNVSVTVGSTSGLPIITTTGGVLSAGSFGTTAGTFCQGNDSRLSDTRNTTNSHTLKFDSGTTEGTDQYTFNGSAAKNINLVAGTNISMTKTSGQVTINSTYSYTLPVATVSTYGGVKFGSDAIQTTAANLPTTTTNRTYAVQANDFGQMLVNVPWVNDNNYPTSYAWTVGDVSGPTGTLTIPGVSSVSFGAIPAVSETTSGVLTTGPQVISGAKTLRNALTINKGGAFDDLLVLSVTEKVAGTPYIGSIVLPNLPSTCTYTLPTVSGTFVTTGDTGTVTNTMLAGSIANAKLTNSSITVNGSAISLGGSATITANTTNALTLSTGLTATSGTFNGSAANTVSVTYGTIAGTACQGNDSRLSDARTPLSHAHGNITNAGAIGSTSGLPIITTTSGVLTTGTFGTTVGTFCQGNDSRLSDTRNTTNSFVVKFDGGTTEGTDQYTFNGSAAKTINIVAGSNITLTEVAGQVTIASTASGGGAPGGNAGEIQYNNAGTFAGAANVEIEGGNLKMLPPASIPVAPADGLVMFDRIHGGRHLPSVIEPTGIDIALQPALFGNSVYMWLPGTGATLGINWGTSFTARNSGTSAAQAHPTKASTNAMTSMTRATFSTGTTATGASGIQSSATVAWRGNAAGLGGFFFFARFGIEALATDQRAFVGLSANNATMAADSSSWNNTCGIGKDSADTTWQIIMRGTAVTKTNTNITVTAGQILDFAMFASPNGSNITCRVADAVTGTVLYDNTSFTTNLPTNTTFMYMQAHTQSTSGTTAKLLALNRMYVETDL